MDLRTGDRTYEASLTRGRGGALTLEASAETPQGGSGSAIELAGVDVEAAVRNDQPDGTVAIALVVGPHTGRIEVRDATSGEVVDHEGGSEANIEGSDRTVVLLLVGDGAGHDLVIVGSGPDGREIRIPV